MGRCVFSEFYGIHDIFGMCFVTILLTRMVNTND